METITELADVTPTTTTPTAASVAYVEGRKMRDFARIATSTNMNKSMEYVHLVPGDPASDPGGAYLMATSTVACLVRRVDVSGGGEGMPPRASLGIEGAKKPGVRDRVRWEPGRVFVSGQIAAAEPQRIPPLAAVLGEHPTGGATIRINAHYLRDLLAAMVGDAGGVGDANKVTLCIPPDGPGNRTLQVISDDGIGVLVGCDAKDAAYMSAVRDRCLAAVVAERAFFEAAEAAARA